MDSPHCLDCTVIIQANWQRAQVHIKAHRAPTVVVNRIVEILVHLCEHGEAIHIYHVAANFGEPCFSSRTYCAFFTGLLRYARNDGVSESTKPVVHLQKQFFKSEVQHIPIVLPCSSLRA